MGNGMNCLVCGSKISVLNDAKISEGRWLCRDCNHYTGVVFIRKLRGMTDDEIIEAVASRRGTRFRPGTRPATSVKDKLTAANKRLQGESDSKDPENDGLIKVNGVIGERLLVDRQNRLVTFEPSPVMRGDASEPSVFGFGDIESFELMEEKNPVRNKMMCRNLKVRISRKDEGDIYIHLLNNDKVYTNTERYMRAESTGKKILALLSDIGRQEEAREAYELPEEEGVTESAGDAEHDEMPEGGSVPDMLREYKKLLDEGVITQEEFEAKKEQLLGLR